MRFFIPIPGKLRSGRLSLERAWPLHSNSRNSVSRITLEKEGIQMDLINPPDKSWWPMCAKCGKKVDSINTIQHPNNSRAVKRYTVECHGEREEHLIGIWAAEQYSRKKEPIPDAFTNKTTAPKSIPPRELLVPIYYVWWLTESDYCGFDPCQERNPLRIPDYAWEQFRFRYGRAGRGRLWVPDHIPVTSLPIAEDDPRWTDKLKMAGGIVIEAIHADDCARWGGTITTLTLDPVKFQDS